MELFVKTRVWSENRQKGCNSSSTTVLNTFWYICLTIFFRKLLFSWIEFDDFIFLFPGDITTAWGRDMGTILRPTQISIRIYGWSQDHLVDLIGIGCTDSPTLRPRTCERLIVSQPLGARKIIKHPISGNANLVITWSCNPHAKISIPRKPNKSGLIEVWHKDYLYLGTNTIGNENHHPTNIDSWMRSIRMTLWS